MPVDCQLKTYLVRTALRVASPRLWLTKVLAGILLLLLHPGHALSASLPVPYNVTVAWNPSPSQGVVGYRLYYGAVSRGYTNSLVTGNVATFPVSGLLSGVTYYFAITAVDAQGLESAFSNEISYSQGIPGAQLQIRAGSGGQFVVTVAGRVGHTFNIEATQDFSSWNVIGTVSLLSSGSSDFTDTNAASFPRRFYRTRDPQP